MLKIVEIDTANRRQVARFLNLPFRLYRDSPQWVPPMADDAAKQLDRKKHPFYRHSTAAFFLVERDGEPAGRIAAIDNTNYNDFNKERTAFFYLFECENDPAASQALF